MDEQYIGSEKKMRVELTIDRTKKLPDGAVPALERELLKRLNDKFDNCSLIIKRTTADGLTVLGADKDDKKTIEHILQETWESADDWFY
jgi:hypothetical protein